MKNSTLQLRKPYGRASTYHWILIGLLVGVYAKWPPHEPYWYVVGAVVVTAVAVHSSIYTRRMKIVVTDSTLTVFNDWGRTQSMRRTDVTEIRWTVDCWEIRSATGNTLMLRLTWNQREVAALASALGVEIT